MLVNKSWLFWAEQKLKVLSILLSFHVFEGGFFFFFLHMCVFLFVLFLCFLFLFYQLPQINLSTQSGEATCPFYTSSFLHKQQLLDKWMKQHPLRLYFSLAFSSFLFCCVLLTASLFQSVLLLIYFYQVLPYFAFLPFSKKNVVLNNIKVLSQNS